jgi:hypothetical protein
MAEIIQQNPVKDAILVLFQDNTVGSIGADDLRMFIDAVFETKENNIRVFERLQDLDVIRQSTNLNNQTVIQKGDLIVITDPQALPDTPNERGLYMALVTNPGSSNNDVQKIANTNYDDFIKQGNDGQFITLENGKLTWVDRYDGYFIKGTDLIANILVKSASGIGEIWIAEDTDLNAEIPGREGDGYSWDGLRWNNIGQLRGPAGDVTDVAFANQLEVDTGFLDNKAVSPKTLNNAAIILSKEPNLGKPNQDGMVLKSYVTGIRYWDTAVESLDDLSDVQVDYGTIQNDSILYYNGTSWEPRLVTNVAVKEFIKLMDTPASYQGQANKTVVVSALEDSLVFVDPVRKSTDLEDFDTRTPVEGQILKFSNGKWTPVSGYLYGSSSSRPQNAPIGTMFFDITLNKPIWKNSTGWVDCQGSAV